MISCKFWPKGLRFYVEININCDIDVYMNTSIIIIIMILKYQLKPHFYLKLG